jgi:hypothetical protein
LGTLAIIGFGSFVVASFVVGLRLLGVAMRTGETPELAIGSAFFASGGCGYGIIIAAMMIPGVPNSLLPIVMLAGTSAASLGALALAFGTRLIFRPADRWPWLMLAAVAIPILLSLGGRLLDLSRFPATEFVFWTFSFGSSLSYGWSAYEALRFYAMLRRRIRIGLGSAHLARRFLLWGIAGIAAVGIYACGAVNRFVDPTTMHPALIVMQAVFGLTAAIGIWFAFFPPLRARHEAVAA